MVQAQGLRGTDHTLRLGEVGTANAKQVHPVPQMELRFASMQQRPTVTPPLFQPSLLRARLFSVSRLNSGPSPTYRHYAASLTLPTIRRGRERSDDFPVQLYCHILEALCRLHEDKGLATGTWMKCERIGSHEHVEQSLRRASITATRRKRNGTPVSCKGSNTW